MDTASERIQAQAKAQAVEATTRPQRSAIAPVASKGASNVRPTFSLLTLTRAIAARRVMKPAGVATAAETAPAAANGDDDLMSQQQ